MAQLVVEVVGRGITATEQKLDKLAKSGKKAGDAVDDLDKKTGKNKQTLGALSLQLQDVSVQLQSGTSALTVFAQQGPQIASIFGPGGAVVGALIGVGALIASLGENAKESAKEIDLLSESLDEIGQRKADLLIDEINKKLESLGVESEKVSARIESLNRSMTSLEADEVGDELVRLRARQEELTAQTEEYEDRLYSLVSAYKEGGGAAQRQAEEYKKLREELLLGVQAFGKSERAQVEASINAQFAAGAQRDELLKLADQYFDLVEAEEARTDALKRQKIELRDAARLSAERARQEAREAAAQQTLQDIDRLGATESQIIGFWYDDNLAKLEGYLSEGLITRQEYAAAQEQLLTESVERQLAIDDRLNEQRRAAEQRRTDEVRRQVEEQKRLEEERQRVLLDSASATSQSLGTITQALRDGGKEQTAAYRLLFAAQQASAIPSMIVATEEGATKALALGPIAGPIAAGAIRALGYASIGTVAGQSIGSLAGRAQGGDVTAGTPYMVGERGREVFVPSTSGTIVPNAGMGAMVNVTVIDRSTNGGNSVSVRQLTERDVEILIEDRVPRIMAREQADPYSAFSKTQRSTTSASRRL